jgi:hypothetical protein
MKKRVFSEKWGCTGSTDHPLVVRHTFHRKTEEKRVNIGAKSVFALREIKSLRRTNGTLFLLTPPTRGGRKTGKNLTRFVNFDLHRL